MRRVKGWLLPISVTLGVVWVAAVLLWSRVDWRAKDPLQEDVAMVSGGPLTSPSGVRLTTTTGASAASGATRPLSAIPGPRVVASRATVCGAGHISPDGTA